MELRVLLVACLAIVVAASGPAQATDATSGGGRRPEFSVGAGVGVAPSYEGSDDYEPAPLWNAQAANLYHPETYLRLVGTRFESNLMPGDHVRLGFVAGYLSDYDDVEDDRVEELNRPSDALQLGIIAGYDFTDEPNTDYVVEVEATYDALHGNGGLITPRARIDLPLGERISLGGAVSATWASEDYVSNRFGISGADSIRSGLDEYEADAGFKDFSIDTSVTYAFAEAWSVSALGGYQRMLGDAADSPIVEDRGTRDNLFLGTLVNYRF